MRLIYKIYLLLFTASSFAQANPPSGKVIGVAAIKEQAFHDDSSAKIVPYTELIDDRKYSVKINTGSLEFAFERSKLAGTVDLLMSLPADIRTESELAPVRMALKNISNFITRFPKSEPLLKSHVLSFTAYINSFEQGSRRLGGRWVDKKTIEETERAELDKIAVAKKAEDKRIAEIDRLERARVAELQRVANLKSEEAAREVRSRAESIELQSQILTALRKGDARLAGTLMNKATRSSPGSSLGSFARGVELFIQLSADKSLSAVDTDWKNPSFPDADVFHKIPGLLTSLSKYEQKDIHPELARLPEGLSAANLLLSFSEDCRSKGGGDQNHPIQALKKLRGSEVYRQVKDTDTFFAKPFISRLTALDKLIGPQLAAYETNLTEGKKLEKKEQFQAAAIKYRAALELDPSGELEKLVKACEEKTTGF
jgi:hypothetical protein